MVLAVKGKVMKRINIKFINQKNGMEFENYIYKLLCKNFDVHISDTPDFIIVDLIPSYDGTFTEYNCSRIGVFFGENANPDFSLFDFIIGNDECNYYDRYYRYPLFMNYFRKYSYEELLNFNNKLFYSDNCIKNDRIYFCDFIYSHKSFHGVRELLLERLNSYKRVECCGTYLNNMPDNYLCNNYNTKLDFQKNCKFSIACESVSQLGFTTEKILHPFRSGSIPIYFGNPEINKIFNEKAFINCHSFDTIEDVFEYVKYIDNNTEIYYNMLNEPIFNDRLFPYKTLKGFEDFLIYIFSQDINKTIKRPICFLGCRNNDLIKELVKIKRSNIYKYLFNPLLKINNKIKKLIKI